MVSARFGDGGVANSVSVTREALLAQGVKLTELTDTNPTRHGLFDDRITQVLAATAGAAGQYDPDPKGPLAARTALAERFGGEPNDYWLTASTSEAYSWLLALLTNPGDTVAIPAPGYPLIGPLANYSLARTTNYRTFYLQPHGWEYDLDSVRDTLNSTGGTMVSQVDDEWNSALAHWSREEEDSGASLRAPRHFPKQVSENPQPACSGARALVVVNPNNPTGAYTDTATATRLAEIAAEHGVPIIADEVFYPHRLQATDTARLSGNTDTVTFGLDGVSKLLCAPQLKLGWIRLSGPASEIRPIATVLDRIADTFLSVNAVTALALPTLLALADDITAKVVARLTANLATAHAVFNTDGLRVRTVGGGWMLLLDVPGIRADDELELALLRNAHLSVHPAWFYDLPSPGTLAISLLPEEPVFKQNCERLLAALKAL
jgi:aspartate/methionine/tyrosine aminotransferase